MNDTKEKKPIAPNECSILRWFLVLLIGFGGGTIALAPLEPFLKNTTDTILGITYKDFFGLLSFVPMFVLTVIALKFVAKTSVKDFILGVGGTLNKKLALIILGLYTLGMILPYLLTIGNISFRGVDPAQYAFLIFFNLLVLWMQTTFEEFIFRGLFLRWACQNEIGYTKKAMLAAVISSLVFMAAHLYNPEITTQSGIDIVLAASSYFISGFACAWADLHFKSLVPGIVIHWCNNFILSVIISQNVSAITNPTLLIDATPKIALWDAVSTVIVYLPVVILIVCSFIKGKKTAPAEKQ